MFFSHHKPVGLLFDRLVCFDNLNKFLLYIFSHFEKNL